MTNLILVIMLFQKDNNDYRHFLQRVGNCKKEGIMVEVTRQATEQVGEYFKNREISPIRIFLNEGG